MSSGEIRDPGASPAEAAPGGADEPAGATTARAEHEHGTPRNMLPGRERRQFGLERLVVRLVATCGVVGIGVLLGAILADNKVQGWIIGLVIAAVSVVLSAILWSSRQM